MDILGQSALIVAVSAFSLAVTAMSRNLRNKLVLSYALLCTTISFWAFFFFLEKIFGTGTFYKFHLAFNLLLAPIGLFFVRVLTRVETVFSRWFYRLSVVYAIAVIILEWTNLSELPLIQNLAFFGPSFLVLDCIYLMFVERHVRKSETRRSPPSSVFANFYNVGLPRRTWIYVGALFILIFAVMDHIPWLGDVIPTIGNVLLCIYLFIISEAIIHQRLLNMSALLNRVVVLVFISTCFTLIYTVLVAWIEGSPGLFILNTFLASFIILILVDPIKKLTNFSVLHLFSRKYLRLQEKIEEAQRALTGVIDTVGLAQLTLNFLESTIEFESASVFILRSDGTKFRRIRGVRDDLLANREILSSHPIIEFFREFFGKMRRRGEAPVILNHYLENEIDRAVSHSQRQSYEGVLNGLQGLNANIAIPFLHGNTVLGFVAIQAPSPPEPWGSNWGMLAAIYPFFLQAARTLKNMDVYVRLREKERLASLGVMAAGLAHEIRNPLGAIKGAAQYLVTEEGSSQAQSPFLQVIIEEVNRLNKVVTQFLDYSRPLSADMVETDLGHILERTYVLFQSAPQKMKIKMELVPPAGGFGRLPRVACAPEQIKQVLVNFVQNSVQSLNQSPPLQAEAVIRMGAAVVKDPELPFEVVLFVEDNGRGISRENLEKIFIPFFTTSPGGTGLGLSICARIIEAHGGRIDVTSEEWKATRFSMYLPALIDSRD